MRLEAEKYLYDIAPSGWARLILESLIRVKGHAFRRAAKSR